ncbi:AAA family ATPase [Acinetobacter nosocomialis]|uniref:AAA family ATPase n=8 Tax=Acinetobacter calcoaceticus/baumannii complex TaxID=909768 RepID=UPI0024DE4C99|nr:AAA family ATPase [Acinetobacter nosocomialis]MDR9576352.1 AAA family ATPase [Acinetobacter nosocomialis]
MKSIKINSIKFDKIGFRKLANLDIKISPRITIIAGHNGIGKSSILGLLANGSSDKKHVSYFEKSFRAEFNEIFHLDPDHDVKPVNERGYLYIDYLIETETGIENFIKKCSVGANTKTDPATGQTYIDRVRVIPRSEDTIRSKELNLSIDGKMPIPTIYLGMSRITPIGEIDHDNIEKKELRVIEDEDKAYIEDKFKRVIDYTKNSDKDCIVDHNFKGSKKRSKIPNTDHSTLAISLGQDSLSSIITALASFKKIKRELGDEYIGGLLVIDEIEAGLHPRAQIKLMDLLKSQAKNLKLQIVLTSHSLTVIKYIFDLKDPNNTSELDSVVYLADTRVPRLFKDPTYTKIKHDMLLVNNEERNYPKEKIIKIYFEDDEAKYFFEKILEHKNLTNGEMAFGANIETISLKVGSEILVKLAPTDNYFKMAVLIADNDVASRSNNRKIIDTHTNFCVLPASKFIKENSPSKDRNPESLIYNFIKNRFDNPKEFKDFWDESDAYSTDYVLDHILTLSDTDRTNRVKMKSWFNSCRSYFDEQKIVQKWCDENMEQVDAFITDLNQAIDEASKNIEMAKVV